MRDLAGRVAVVTGGAGGIGRAMGERLAAEGMRVVLADVERPALDATVDELRDRGLDVAGELVDVADAGSVEALRDRVLARHGAVHVVCNNAGVGAGAAGQMWDHELNDWRWALGVNLWGVIHGIRAFVPAMIEGGEEGHVVNTSSGNGGIAPLPSTAIYATTKAAVVTLTECLYGQLQATCGGRIGASVLFPGPHMLRTGLFNSWRNRPAELDSATAKKGSVESFEKQMAEAGVNVTYTPVEDVAGDVVEGIRSATFWILPRGGRSDAQIQARAASMLDRTDPSYLVDVTGLGKRADTATQSGRQS